MALFNFFKKSKIDKQLVKQYALSAQRCLEIYDDSQRLFQETNNPDVFFMRYELAIKQLKELSEIIKTTNNGIKYKGENVSEKIALLENERNRMYLEFIARYHDFSVQKAQKLKTEKGQQTNLHKSLDKLLEQNNYLSTEHINKIQELWNGSQLIK